MAEPEVGAETQIVEEAAEPVDGAASAESDEKVLGRRLRRLLRCLLSLLRSRRTLRGSSSRNLRMRNLRKPAHPVGHGRGENAVAPWCMMTLPARLSSCESIAAAPQTRGTNTAKIFSTIECPMMTLRVSPVATPGVLPGHELPC